MNNIFQTVGAVNLLEAVPCICMNESFEQKDNVLPKLKFADVAPAVWKKLDEIKRTGWVTRGVQYPETVQQHTISLRALAHEVFSRGKIFSEKEENDLIDMLEVHDWPEAIVGDEVVLEDGSKEKQQAQQSKSERELGAMTQICAAIPNGTEILNLWLRFEHGDDAVADIARQLDKCQAVEKAMEYEKAQGIALFKEFKDYSIKYITHPLLLERLARLESE